jgi:hypothetical protein
VLPANAENIGIGAVPLAKSGNKRNMLLQSANPETPPAGGIMNGISRLECTCLTCNPNWQCATVRSLLGDWLTKVKRGSEHGADFKELCG